MTGSIALNVRTAKKPEGFLMVVAWTWNKMLYSSDGMPITPKSVKVAKPSVGNATIDPVKLD